jgi:zinc protease
MLKKFWPLILFFLSFNLILVSPVEATEPEINFDDYGVNMVDYTLPNGLRVILAEDHSAPVVSVSTWYDVGSANDPEGHSGFAHLFEHLMFRGSDNVEDGEYDLFLEAVGAENNAYTLEDYTAYWVRAPAHELPRVLWLESDRMASLQLTEEIFEAERDVVIQEYNQDVLNSPYGLTFEHLYSLPFQGYPPYERTVIGNPAELEAASLEEVQQFFDTYYKPNNATLAIVGDIKLEATQALVDAYFGDIPATAEVTPILEQYPLPDFPVGRTDASTGCNIGWEETLVDPLAELPLFAGAVVGPPPGTSDYYALDLLGLILGNGDSSRFYQNIVSQGLASEAWVGLDIFKGASLFNGYVVPNTDETAEEAQALFREELQQVIEEGVTELELARAKQQVKVDTLTYFRTSSLDTAEMLQDAILNFDDPQAIAKELERYEAVTLADIDRVAQTYLCKKPLNMIITLPEGEEVQAEYPGPLVTPVAVKPAASPIPAATPEKRVELPEGVVNRTGLPASLPLSKEGGLTYETFELDNGLKVIFVEQHELPKLRLQLYVGGSQMAVPASQQGLADLTAEMLTKGTTTRSATEIAEQIESEGGYLSAAADTEWLLLEADALKTEAPLAFELLADVARNATFPQEEFEVIQEQSLSSQAFNEVDPNFLADQKFNQLTFGDHPYGSSVTTESLEELSREDIVDFYQTYFKPNNALLVITADMSLEEVRRQTEQVFSDWPAGEVPDFLDQPQPITGKTGVIYLIDQPDAQQATLRVGNLAIAANDPNRYPLEMVHTTLGGSFFSRLNMNLRADKGYTYGVYSDLDHLNETGAFLISTDVDQEYTGEALQEILKEWETIRTQPLSAQELADKKGLTLGSLALTLEDPVNFASTLATYQLTGLPLTELESYQQGIEELTSADILKAATTYLSDQPVIVVAGNAELLKPQLEPLGEVVEVE